MGRRILVGSLVAMLLTAASPAAAKCNMTQVGALPVHMDGLSPLVDATVNGHPTRLVADSGAFFSTLSNGDAEKFDLKALPVRWVYVEGVSGMVLGRIQTAQSFVVLGQTFRNIEFVAEPVELRRGVSGYLGQNFLNVTDTEYDLSDGLIRFFHPDDCQDATLAYWDPGRPYSVIPIHKVSRDKREIVGEVSVNGVRLSAQFDTGARYSTLSLQGAARAGIKKGDPRLKPGGVSSGIGWRLNQTWIAPVDSFKIGDEEVRQTGLRVSEMNLSGADMLLGADFFLSHHILVANSQQKLYLTYNGGPVFKLEEIPDAGPSDAKPGPTAAPAPAAASEPGQDPKDADGFTRRAEAFGARRDYARALADFDKALVLAPKDPRILYARSQAYAAQKQTKLALADLDEALRQKPFDVDMLVSRGVLRLRDKQLDLAKADFDAAVFRDPSLTPSIAAGYAEQADYPQALAEYDAWLNGAHKSEDKVAGLEGKCWVRAKWGQQLDQALKDCNAAFQIAPYWGDVIYTRGFLYLRMGRYGDAIRDLDRTVKGQPKLALAMYMRGAAKIGAGKATDGKADIEAAIAIDPKVTERATELGLAPEHAKP